MMDVREVTTISDYFVICSGGSDRQLKAIVQHVTEELKKEGYPVMGRPEGEPSGGWVLMDYGDVVVHAFLPEQRSYYDLEGLWNEAKTLVRIQ